MSELARLYSWVEDVYMPKLHSAERELVFEHRGVWEKGDRFSEYFLQIVWNERYLEHDLRTVSGEEVRVIHPGTWNVSSGPDFHNASILLDGHLLRGDVEIHQRTSDWSHHGHGGDPRYDGVMLHVVWEHDVELSDGPPHTLVMSGSLQSAWHLLLQDVEDASYPYARQVGHGDCAMRWAAEDDDDLRTLLASAGLARLAAKGSRIARMCVERGDDQTLYELFFDCLGYTANRQPFRELAVLVPLEALRDGAESCAAFARLFGAAGLLPDVTQVPVLPEWRDVVQRLWSGWWCSGSAKAELSWCFAGTRPFNSPHRRLAAGVRWLLLTGYHPRDWLVALASGCHTGRELLKALLSLEVHDGQWEWYRDFGTRLKHPVKLLGEQRLKDIAANLFLPYLVSLEERDGGSSALSDLARQAYVMLSPGQVNRSLVEASHRFLTPPSRSRELLKRYCHQQGLLDIYRNFCLVFNGCCAECPFCAVEMAHGEERGVEERQEGAAAE